MGHISKAFSVFLSIPLLVEYYFYWRRWIDFVVQRTFIICSDLKLISEKSHGPGGKNINVALSISLLGRR